MNVSEIAYAVGFSDPKYFSKCFKTQFGKSPKDFKNPDSANEDNVAAGKLVN